MPGLLEPDVMTVTICGVARLQETIAAWKPDTVVSTVPAPVHDLAHVEVLIDDLYNKELAGYKRALRTVLACRGKRILVHCEHGKSRSAALAIALIYREDGAVGVAAFLAAHQEVEPNPLLLFFADELLEAHGDLLRSCRGRYKGASL